MNWYASQQNQILSNSYRPNQMEKQMEQEFDSIYDDVFTAHHDFWMPLIEEHEEDYWFQMQSQQIIFQGKLFQKNPKNRKWEAQHLELFQDKFVRVTSLPDDTMLYEYCRINQCFLKKIKYSESSFQAYKFGFRLQIGKKKSEFFTETNEIFTKWHNVLKRYTLLPKFAKKYKLITKIKVPEPFQSSSTYKTVRICDNAQFQVRVVEKHHLSEQQRLQLLKEIKILRRLDHPSVIKLLEVYEDSNFLYIIFDPFAGREIKYRLQELVTAPEKVIAELIYRILTAINHCHQRNVFHRDLKFDTIFHRFTTSLTDICLSYFCQAEIYDQRMKTQMKKVGTPGFLAPEVFKSKYYDPKVDVYSIGILLYFFIYSRMPFGNEFNEIIYNNEQGDIDFGQRSRFSTSAMDLLVLMLKKDPAKRISAFQALNHHWFINMKIKDQVNRPPINKNQPSVQNLSTIIEKSDFLDVSSTSVINHQVMGISTPRTGKKRQTKPQTRSKSSELGIFDEEFACDSLQDKLQDLTIQCPPKVPSKQRHLTAIYQESSSYSPQKSVGQFKENSSTTITLKQPFL